MLQQDQQIRNIRYLFEQEDDYYKPIRVDRFAAAIISNIKVTVIKIKIYL